MGYCIKNVLLCSYYGNTATVQLTDFVTLRFIMTSYFAAAAASRTWKGSSSTNSHKCICRCCLEHECVCCSSRCINQCSDAAAAASDVNMKGPLTIFCSPTRKAEPIWPGVTVVGSCPGAFDCFSILYNFSEAQVFDQSAYKWVVIHFLKLRYFQSKLKLPPEGPGLL